MSGVIPLNKTIAKVKNGIHGTIVIPGDKSVSHRSLMISALCDGQTVHVKNFLRSADCLSTLEAIRALGVTVKENEDNSLDITGVGLQGLQEPQTIVDAGDSGTLLRLMMGLLAAQPFLTTFTGDAALHKRPMGRVIKPLEMMGAKIVGRKDNTLLPITILPNEKKNFHGITYEMPVASAQVKSAILLAALTAGVEVKIIEPVPSRNHTECMMRAFGINVETKGNEVVFHIHSSPAPYEFAVIIAFKSIMLPVFFSACIYGHNILMRQKSNGIKRWVCALPLKNQACLSNFCLCEGFVYKRKTLLKKGVEFFKFIPVNLFSIII